MGGITTDCARKQLQLLDVDYDSQPTTDVKIDVVPITATGIVMSPAREQRAIDPLWLSGPTELILRVHQAFYQGLRSAGIETVAHRMPCNSEEGEACTMRSTSR